MYPDTKTQMLLTKCTAVSTKALSFCSCQRSAFESKLTAAPKRQLRYVVTQRCIGQVLSRLKY